MARLSNEDAEALIYDWSFWARPKQLPPPGDWQFWINLAGRGFGKTRTGVEWVRGEVESQRRGRLALVARTAADVRDVLVEGESGILACSPRNFRPKYEPSKRRLTWPNGAMATTYSADEPDALRGPQHDGALCDELASWKNPETWDMLMFGLRLGTDPRCVIMTTPKPVKHLKDLLSNPATVVTRGSTYENRENLAPAFLHNIVRKYEGTRLGRQELNAELLEDVPGALWKRAQIENLRVSTVPNLVRIIVAIDPAVTSSDESDETGIIAAGVAANGHGYILDDKSLRATPHGWASEAIATFSKLRGDRIVAEANNGGDMVESTLRTVDKNIPYTKVHASRGKVTRAEPVAALYEQGKVHHVGSFPELEDQMCTWLSTDNTSPDRMDALVWALTELMLDAPGEVTFGSLPSGIAEYRG